MALQMILCLETNKRARTDCVYVNETIRNFYDLDDIKLSWIYMNSKTKFDAKDVCRDIKTKVNMYKHGKTQVIYCVDTDDFEINMEHRKAMEKIDQFCRKNAYELIWFCHDVEEVYLGERVSDDVKVREAEKFKRSKKIESVLPVNLTQPKEKKCSSNIMTVLDKYLSRKK